MKSTKKPMNSVKYLLARHFDDGTRAEDNVGSARQKSTERADPIKNVATIFGGDILEDLLKVFLPGKGRAKNLERITFSDPVFHWD